MGLHQVKQVNPKKMMSPIIEVIIGKLAEQVNPVNKVKQARKLQATLVRNYRSLAEGGEV